MTPSDDLPFLLLHGSLIGKLAIGAAIVAVLGALRLVRVLNARQAIRAAVAALERDGVIRGRLGGPGSGPLAATLTAVGPPATVHWRAGELWLDTDQGRVAIEGVVEVVAGSRAAASRNRVPPSTTAAHLEAAAESAPFLRERLAVLHARLASLYPGDEVVATGALEPAPTGEATGYRDGEVAWTLRPSDAAIRIAARRPRAAVLRLGAPLAAFVIGVTGFGAYQLAKHYGGQWRHECIFAVDDPQGPVELSNSHPCALMEATPAGGDAQQLTLDRLDKGGYRDEQILRQRLALAAEVGGCTAVAQRLYDAHRYEDAAVKAHGCGARRVEHLALLSLGRFEEAAAVPVVAENRAIALPDAPTLIGAGRWRDAAEVVRARAQSIAETKHEPDAVRGAALTVMHYRCLAELLAHHGGDPDALGRLRALYDQPDGAVCSVMLSEVASGMERARLLDDHRERPALLDTSALAGALAWASGIGRQGYLHRTPENLLAKPGEMSSWATLPKVWLIAAERGRLAAEAGHGLGLLAWLTDDALLAQRADHLHWLAVAQAFDGDIAGAEATVREALALPGDLESRYDWHDRPHLVPALALYTASTTAPLDFELPDPDDDPHYNDTRRELWFHDFGRLLLRAGRPIDKAYFGPEDAYLAALRATATGDGEPLARYMSQTQLWSWWTDGDIQAVLPRLTSSRDAVVRQLIWSTPREGGALDYHFPFGLLGQVIEHRAALRVAGATTEEARYDAIYRRLSAMLSDRRKLVALMMWDL